MQLTLLDLLEATPQPSSSGKTCPASSTQKTMLSAASLPSSQERMKPLMSKNGRVLVWSMADDGEWRGPSSTPSSSHSPSAAAASLSLPSLRKLSDVLETEPIPQQYFLSGRACAGILRRAANRGKVLPEALVNALQAVASLT